MINGAIGAVFDVMIDDMIGGLICDITYGVNDVVNDDLKKAFHDDTISYLEDGMLDETINEKTYDNLYSNSEKMNSKFPDKIEERDDSDRNALFKFT